MTYARFAADHLHYTMYTRITTTAPAACIHSADGRSDEDVTRLILQTPRRSTDQPSEVLIRRAKASGVVSL